MRHFFPSATHVVCTRHLKNNAKDKLVQLGCSEQHHREIITSIFREADVVAAEVIVVFNNRGSTTEEIVA